MAVLTVVPEEIIIHEILTRLPVKSLVRYRCVCKSWNSLLYNPDYLCSLSQNPKSDTDDCLLFMYKYNRKDIDLFILSGKQLLDTRIDNYVPWPSVYNCIHLVGSINGLVCMALEIEGEHQFILWNPTIRFSKTISVPKHLECLKLHYLRGYGFGWDSVTNDYKLIICGSSSSVVVYSSNTNHWSYIKHPSTSRFYFKHPCVIVNGSPYWIIDRQNDPILKFNTRNNEFTYLNVPPAAGCCIYSLINLNDCLALISGNGWDTPTVHRFDEEHNTWMHMYTLIHRVDYLDVKVSSHINASVVVLMIVNIIMLMGLVILRAWWLFKE